MWVFDPFVYLHGNLTQRFGYEWGVNTGKWGFDFRKGPQEHIRDGSYELLKKQIELYYTNANRDRDLDVKPPLRVVLVSLSQGGPVVHNFLDWVERSMGDEAGRQWKDKHVERWVSLSGVFGGTSMMTSAVVQPDDGDVGWISVCHSLISVWHEP